MNAIKLGSLGLSLVGVGFVVFLWLSRILEPRDSDLLLVERLSLVAIVAIIILQIYIFQLPRGSNQKISLLMILIILMTIIPIAAEWILKNLRMNEFHQSTVEIRNVFLKKLDEQSAMITSRAHDKRPFSADEALTFLVFIKGSDLRYRAGLQDYSKEALALLERAIKSGVLNPNLRFESDSSHAKSGDPLFLAFYYPRLQLAQRGHFEMDRLDKEIFKTMLDHGADLSMRDRSGKIINTYLKAQ